MSHDTNGHIVRPDKDGKIVLPDGRELRAWAVPRRPSEAEERAGEAYEAVRALASVLGSSGHRAAPSPEMMAATEADAETQARIAVLERKLADTVRHLYDTRLRGELIVRAHGMAFQVLEFRLEWLLNAATTEDEETGRTYSYLDRFADLMRADGMLWQETRLHAIDMRFGTTARALVERNTSGLRAGYGITTY